MRRPRVAFVFAIAVVAVSGATGHSAAVSPLFATPARALHLLAVAAWLGGLLWLLVCQRSAVTDLAREAFRVSGVALWASLIVALSGVAMTALFLASPRDLIDTAYGAVLLAKVAGLVALLAFGAHHRFRALPRLVGDSTTSAHLATTLRRELATMAVVVLLGGLLAYVPPRSARDTRPLPSSPIE
jgi:putative copper export protein